MLWLTSYLQDKEVKEGEEKKPGEGEEGDGENEELEDEEEEFGDDDYAQVLEFWTSKFFLNNYFLISARKISSFSNSSDNFWHFSFFQFCVELCRVHYIWLNVDCTIHHWPTTLKFRLIAVTRIIIPHWSSLFSLMFIIVGYMIYHEHRSMWVSYYDKWH